MEQRPKVANAAMRRHSAPMKRPRPAAPIFPDARRTALRDALAVLVSSAGLLARHIDRLPREKRDAQFAALNTAAAEVQTGVELLLEGCR